MISIYATEIPVMGSAVFIFDSEDDESRSSPAKVTEYPVDSGFTNSDGVSLGARKFRFGGVVSCTPITPLVGPSWDGLTGASRVMGAMDALRKIQEAKQPVAIGLKYWSPLAWIGTVEEKTGEQTGSAVAITIEAVEMRRATPTMVSIPAAKLAPRVAPQTAKAGATGAGSKSSGTPSALNAISNLVSG